MAIDTVADRASVIGFESPWMLVIPDGTIDQENRQTITWLYGGLAAGAPVAGGSYHWNTPYTRVLD